MKFLWKSNSKIQAYLPFIRNTSPKAKPVGSLAGIAYVDLLLASKMAEPNMMDTSVKILFLMAEMCIRWRLTADWKPWAEGTAFLTE